jgi:hypothetical protein
VKGSDAALRSGSAGGHDGRKRMVPSSLSTTYGSLEAFHLDSGQRQTHDHQALGGQ